MAREGIERRLTVILCADVVEYSRLMAVDEAGTFAQLKTLRKELIEPKTADLAVPKQVGRRMAIPGAA